MKGILFNILEDFLTKKLGEEKLENILDSSKLVTTDPFVAPGTYPDEDFLEIVSVAAYDLDWTISQFYQKLGHFAFFKLAERYPVFVSPYTHPKDFLKTIENVVHVEVRKLYSETYLPTFVYHEPAEDELVITYYSKRKLYDLMDGLIDGVASHFKYSIQKNKNVYIKDGIEFCDFHLNFRRND